MPKSLAAGAVLTTAAVAVVIVSSALGLELESVALLGVGMGAVIALLPVRGPLVRVAGFAAGSLVGWAGYALRAGFLPDTAGGRAVALGIVVGLCFAVAAATRERVPAWTTLLGAASVAGAYELTYTAAPQELPSTSISTATSLLLTVAVGFIAAAAFVPDAGSEQDGTPPEKPSEPADHDQQDVRLDEMMENVQ